ncbi:methyltransferase family protein [Candidatus Colwellia aromaticivorans]|uniref:methyltransferase family protein n=1 Tax=Candidatus Colwellia aromaticivorans TaxID=2267621 RepID=UPI000DF38351|nr:isoprenylcysteine carboxylmethyltransferase family protein [Candidatus Colwellia aromaticivorans]
MSLALKVIPPVQFIICASLMFGLASYFPQYRFTLSLSFPIIICLIVLATIIGSLALYDFHKHKTTYHPHTPEKTSTVVDSGIYAYSRNPMYLALVLVLLALALYFTNVTCFAVIPLFIWYITHYQIKPEELMLNKLFPTDYQAYSQKVRRWL